MVVKEFHGKAADDDKFVEVGPKKMCDLRDKRGLSHVLSMASKRGRMMRSNR